MSGQPVDHVLARAYHLIGQLATAPLQKSDCYRHPVPGDGVQLQNPVLRPVRHHYHPRRTHPLACPLGQNRVISLASAVVEINHVEGIPLKKAVDRVAGLAWIFQPAARHRVNRNCLQFYPFRGYRCRNSSADSSLACSSIPSLTIATATA